MGPLITLALAAGAGLLAWGSLTGQVALATEKATQAGEKAEQIRTYREENLVSQFYFNQYREDMDKRLTRIEDKIDRLLENDR